MKVVGNPPRVHENKVNNSGLSLLFCPSRMTMKAKTVIQPVTFSMLPVHCQHKDTLYSSSPVGA
eukprot:12415306-Karenia_brevis.AAC.1